MTGPLRTALRRIVAVHDDEIGALLGSFTFCFLIFAGWYILRPIREEMGIAGGTKNLPWMFTGTLLATLAASPLFSALVSRYSRRRFIPAAYHFFSLNLILFFALFHTLEGDARVIAARAFFIWTSVFNLFVLAVFWGYMADRFRSDQGMRLFGFISSGGTLGGIAGSLLTASIVHAIGSVQLLIAAAVLIELSLVAFRRLEDGVSPRPAAPAVAPASITARAAGAGGERLDRTGILGGLTLVLRSPYLLTICLYMLLFTTTSTFAYLEQARIVQASSATPEVRTAIFARIDLLVNLFSFLAQMFLTGRILKAIGLGAAQSILPVVTLAGFTALGLNPTLNILAGFQVARRSTDYAAAKPAREVLYTVVPREEKYKAKSFIDTFVYRGGDAVGGWVHTLITGSGDSTQRVAIASLPIAGLWIAVCLALGRWQRRLAAGEPLPSRP